MSEWNDDIEAAPKNEFVLGFALDNEPITVKEFLTGVDYAEGIARGYPMVGRVIFPKSKRRRRKDGVYNFKAIDGRGTEYVATHWMPLPKPPLRGINND